MPTRTSLARLALCASLLCLVAACTRVAVDKRSEEVASGSQKASAAAVPAFPELTEWLARNGLAVNVGRDGRMDYDGAVAQGAIIAYGEGGPANDAAGPGKKRLTALRAAEVVAQRNLAALCAGRAMNGELRFTTHTVQLEAFLKGAAVVMEAYDPARERAAVLLKLNLRGANGVVNP